VVEWVARYKPKQFARAGLVRPVVEALCAMCGEPDPPDHDPDGDELPPAQLASQVPAALCPPSPASALLLWGRWTSRRAGCLKTA